MNELKTQRNKQSNKVNVLWSLRKEIQTQTVDATLPH